MEFLRRNEIHMKSCKKCKKVIADDSRYCQYCGYKQVREKRRRRLPNGAGTVYKRGNTWTIKVVMGWHTAEDGHKVPDTRTKGGFPTEKEALAYGPTLRRKISPIMPAKRFSEVYDDWMAKYKNRHRSDSTIAGYVSAFKHFKRLHGIYVNEVNANMLQDCIDDCKCGKRTKELMKVVANLVTKYAKDGQMIFDNPAENLYCGDEKTGHREPITEDELSTIVDNIGIEPYAEYVVALCYLGFRPTEFFKLTKKSFHQEGDIYYLIGGSKTEAGINRQVTIPPKIIQIIKSRLQVEGTQLLFPRYKLNRKKEFVEFIEMDEAYFRESIFKPMLEHLGIAPGRTPYATRHTYANKLKAVQAPDKDKASLIGHTDYEITKKFYQSTNLQERRAITDKI